MLFKNVINTFTLLISIEFELFQSFRKNVVEEHEELVDIDLLSYYFI